MKKFHTISKFTPLNIKVQPLLLTINTALNKTFTITGLNKNSAPDDIEINWGDGSSILKYNNLPASGNISKTYTGNVTRVITITGSKKILTNVAAVTYKNNTNLISVDGTIFIFHISNVFEETANRNTFFQNCTNLKTVSEDILSCLNIKCNITYIFDGCTSFTTIPENLFRYNTKQNNFIGLFSNTAIKTIPENLFRNNLNMITVSNSFVNCKSLVSIPENLFKYNFKNIHFYNSFSGCTALTSIPEKLFINNKKTGRFELCFNGCSNITSAVPDLWNTNKWPNVYSGVSCFKGSTKATNYTSIPAGWK